jgi:lipoprotein NlpD
VARRAAVALACLALLAACGRDAVRPAPATYVVRAGDTLYSIATRHGLDYREVARWNGLGRDFRIVPGQVLTLRPGKASARAGATAPARAGEAGTRAPAAAGARTGSPSTERGTPVPPARVEPPRGTLPWTWPTDGRVAGPVERPSGGVGLRIDGVAGQDVRAAAPGKVVYTGAGLRSYGQLVIVKHDESFLTAYGHNGTLYVREGDEVRAGQRIAAMGLGPGNQPMLYFEIRYHGRPVDPRPLLPPR